MRSAQPECQKEGVVPALMMKWVLYMQDRGLGCCFTTKLRCFTSCIPVRFFQSNVDYSHPVNQGLENESRKANSMLEVKGSFVSKGLMQIDAKLEISGWEGPRDISDPNCCLMWVQHRVHSVLLRAFSSQVWISSRCRPMRTS